jgi:pyruvate dehydrogenase E2 component (dihydrolipoyllysine-residue acetyltransferase)
MAEVVMPRLSDSMEEGTIVRWLKSDGDEVAKGEELVEIETDKATMTYESDVAGVLEIIAGDGDTLPVGDIIGKIGDDASPGGGGSKKQPAPETEEPAEERAAVAEETVEHAPTNGGDPSASGAPSFAPPAPEKDGERVKASPVARRVAAQLHVDLTALEGSGPGGRIVKSDVEAAAEEGGAAPAAAPAPAGEPAPMGKGDSEVVELTRTQQLIARRMAESKATVPDFTLRMEIDMEDAVGARAQLKEIAREGDVVPSLNDFVVRAVALALRDFPRVNGSYKDGRFELHSRVNVGVAVAAQDALVVPTVFDADRKSLGEIARDVRGLAGKVRDKKITPPELSGGTFTVSNLGMFGVDEFTAVINPPQAAILAVGSVEARPVVRDGETVARRRMNVSLACDHRILYGADAAQFLGRVRDLLERPLALAL